ncbi:MAG: hypothetical protein M3N32_06765 [Actinomycetota bacterium]|nr:hypothetical protein [Actinomycetota bacterium]
MLWLHAIHRGEKGPAINHWFHWLLDSTLGFLPLTPVLFFIPPSPCGRFRAFVVGSAPRWFSTA